MGRPSHAPNRVRGPRTSVVASPAAASVAALVLRCRNRVRMLLMVGYRVSAVTAEANASPRWP